MKQLLNSLFQCLTTIWVKDFFLIFNLSLLPFMLKTLRLVRSLHSLNSLSPSFLYTSFKYWKTTTMSHQSIFFSLCLTTLICSASSILGSYPQLLQYSPVISQTAYNLLCPFSSWCQGGGNNLAELEPVWCLLPLNKKLLTYSFKWPVVDINHSTGNAYCSVS